MIHLLAAVIVVLCPVTRLEAGIPIRYEQERLVDAISDVERTISSDVFFNNAGDVVFSIKDVVSPPQRAPEYYFQRSGEQKVLIGVLAGYDRTYPAVMNAAGVVAGKSTSGDPYQPGYLESAFLWTLETGTIVPAGMNPNQSYFSGFNSAGVASGASRNIGNVFLPVRWTAEGGVTELAPPSGYGYFEVLSINAAGEVLILAADDQAGLQKQLFLATSMGTAPLNIGPMENRDLNQGNVRMNTAGDIAVVVRENTTNEVEVRFLPALNRNDLRTAKLSQPASQVFDFKLNELGYVVFGMSENRVAFVRAAAQSSQIFPGYRPQLNDLGEMIFGQDSRLMYWDTRTSFNPTAVPVSVPQSPRGAPEILALNNSGRLVLGYYTATGSEQRLGVFVPIQAPPPPPPTPPPDPVPPQPPPDPKQERIEALEAQIREARKIRNPQVRQSRIKRLSLTLRRVQASP
jgi:hypothetical protein